MKFRGMKLIEEPMSKDDIAKRKNVLARRKSQMVKEAERAVLQVPEGYKPPRSRRVTRPSGIIHIRAIPDVHLMEFPKRRKKTFKNTPWVCTACKKAKILKWKMSGKKSCMICPRCGWSSDKLVRVRSMKKWKPSLQDKEASHV